MAGLCTPAHLARELNIGYVIVPPEPGNFSALGMLFAKARMDEMRTVPVDLDGRGLRLKPLIDDMETNARAALQRDFGAKPWRSNARLRCVTRASA